MYLQKYVYFFILEALWLQGNHLTEHIQLDIVIKKPEPTNIKLRGMLFSLYILYNTIYDYVKFDPKILKTMHLSTDRTIPCTILIVHVLR